MKRSPAFYNMSNLKERIQRELSQNQKRSENGTDDVRNHVAKKQRTKEPTPIDDLKIEFVDSDFSPDMNSLCDDWVNKNHTKSNFQETFDKELDDCSVVSSVSIHSDKTDDEFSSSQPSKFDVKKFQSDLRKWVIKHQIKPSALTSLLKLLRQHPCFKSLPSDAEKVLQSEQITWKDFNTLTSLVKQQALQIKQLNVSVKRLMNVGIQPSSGFEEDPFCNEDIIRGLLPIKTMDSLEIMESLLEDQASADKFKKILTEDGGKNVANCVKRIMPKLMNDEMGHKFSWVGRKGKAIFKDLKLTPIIFRAVQTHFPQSTNLEIENAVKDWLRTAGGRLQNSNKASLLKLFTKSSDS